jgi:hypothetical protein
MDTRSNWQVEAYEKAIKELNKREATTKTK